MQSESPNIMEDRKGTRECNDKKTDGNNKSK